MSFQRSRKPAPNSRMVGTVNMMALATSIVGDSAAVPYAKAVPPRQSQVSRRLFAGQA